MNIYRGPSTKDFLDESHERVHSEDLSKVAAPWHDQIRFKVNVSKEHWERQAVCHVEFEPEDVMSLHRTLIAGLMERSRMLNATRAKEGILKNALRKIRHELSRGGLGGDQGLLEKISKLAAEALDETS